MKGAFQVLVDINVDERKQPLLHQILINQKIIIIEANEGNIDIFLMSTQKMFSSIQGYFGG